MLVADLSGLLEEGKRNDAAADGSLRILDTSTRGVVKCAFDGLTALSTACKSTVPSGCVGTVW
jgi:hypothetical protein